MQGDGDNHELAAGPLADEDRIASALAATINLRASEADQIWSRYNVMVVGNAVVLGFIATMVSRQAAGTADGLLVMAAAGFGLVLTSFWWRLAVRGWEYLTFLDEHARTLDPSDLNPLVYTDVRRLATRRDGLWTNSISTMARQVVLLFGAAYGGLAIAGVVTAVA